MVLFEKENWGRQYSHTGYTKKPKKEEGQKEKEGRTKHKRLISVLNGTFGYPREKVKKRRRRKI